MTRRTTNDGAKRNRKDERKHKRSNREGNIEKTANGRYRYRIMLDGQKFSATVDSHEAALNAVSKLRTQHHTGLIVDRDDQTVAEYATMWLNRKEIRGRAMKTLANYRMLLDNHVLPEIGGMRVQKVRPAHLSKMFDALFKKDAHVSVPKPAPPRDPNKPPRKNARPPKEAKPTRKLSNATLKLVRTVVHNLFKTAKVDGLIVVNPMESVEIEARASGRAREKTAYTAEQLAALLPVLRKYPEGFLYEFYMALGARRGEALGLRWSDVDLRTGRVTLQEAVKKAPAPTPADAQRTSVAKGHRPMPRGLARGELKTEASRRTLYLPPHLLRRLREHRRAQEALRERQIAAGSPWHDTDLVFTTRNGSVIYPDNVRRPFKRLCVEAGVDVLSIQALRRTYVGLMRAKGAPLEVVSATLGHTRLTTLLAEYRVVQESEKQAHVRDLDDLL
ncbi:tyrosine-type recombinase/integrase [Deinococcus yavapaiensis]|uniref:Integrase-like protein n=1 Tax=Deinococcus yavapaiensis KR-236 TaxID=694435 RepID=A0A318S5M3_9DEIO|nr:site-specific integrase [Deinococcus yavapaiensis]PYE52993.1 integrase-like protein [Deinococcus yavapaiensis KR-236]